MNRATRHLVIIVGLAAIAYLFIDVFDEIQRTTRPLGRLAIAHRLLLALAFLCLLAYSLRRRVARVIFKGKPHRVAFAGNNGNPLQAGLAQREWFCELVENAIGINIASIQRHGIHFVRRFEELPLVTIDKRKLLQILVNLISNAKYALLESGRPDKRIVVRLGKAGADRVRIEVEDNGVGIPAENQTRIFSYGFTTRERGHGFGLHSAALAAEELNGALTARGDGPGTGATFSLEVPCRQTGGRPCLTAAH